MNSRPKRIQPGRLNVKAGLAMVVVAVAWGALLHQVQPLSKPPATPFSSGDIPLFKYAWWIAYAHLGNMGLINLGGGLVMVLWGSRLRWPRLLSGTLLIGGLAHPLAWILVGMTGMEDWRWLGRFGLLAVIGSLLSLLFPQVDRPPPQP